MVWANLKGGLTKTSTTADDINPAFPIIRNIP